MARAARHASPGSWSATGLAVTRAIPSTSTWPQSSVKPSIITEGDRAANGSVIDHLELVGPDDVWTSVGEPSPTKRAAAGPTAAFSHRFGPAT